MKILKHTLGIFLAAVILAGCACVASAKTSSTPTKKTIKISRFSRADKVAKKASGTKKLTYYAKVNDKNNAIKVDFWDAGDSYHFLVTGKKTTPKTKPTITVYYKNKNNKKVNVTKYTVTVTKAEKQSFDDFALNPDTTKKMTLFNSRVYGYSFKLSDSNIAEIDTAYYATDKKFTYPVKGLKKGTTKVTVYIKNVKIGEFNLEVKDIPAHLSKKTLTLKYNKHGSSTFMSESNAVLTDLLEDMKAKAKYTVEIDSDKVADKINYAHYSLMGENKNTNLIYATSTGSVTASVYEKIGDNKKTKIDTLKIKVKDAKMRYVALENRLFYDDDIFGNGDFVEFLDLTAHKKLNMFPTIEESLINNTYTGSHFKKSEYSMSYKSSKPSVASVSKKGVVTAKKVGDARITYTIKFSDGSKFSGECAVSVSASGNDY